MGSVELPWGGDGTLSVALPPPCQVVAPSKPDALEPLEDLPSAIRDGLQAPEASRPLQALVGPKTPIALVIDDAGLPTPVDRLASVVFDSLLEAGAWPENITGLFAIGTHRVMSQEEMTARAGWGVVSQIACHSFDCHDERAFVTLGKTRRGTPVHLNRIVAEADLRILIGAIEPHPQAGFDVGLKNPMPGLAAAQSIGHNRLQMPSPRHYNMIGTWPED